MEITTTLADDLLDNVKQYTHSASVTEAITLALQDWIHIYEIRELNKKIAQKPVLIKDMQKIREINRLP